MTKLTIINLQFIVLSLGNETIQCGKGGGERGGGKKQKKRENWPITHTSLEGKI